jgi:DNA polymerase-4
MDTWRRIIVHADLDAFYAAVEQRDDPSLRGKPVLVGPNSYRGVVLTASYEARPYGVGSAMPVAEARRRCPHAVMVPPRFERYEEVSKQVMDVFGNFSPAVEPLSLDEAFLDMSGAEHLFGPPETMGRRIKAAVFEATRLNVSVGISGNKYVAKVAGAHGKPNGLLVVPPDRAVEWLAPMPVDRLWGVGVKTTAKLHRLGLMTIGDIAARGERELRLRLGAYGSHFYHLALALDPRRVDRGRTARSIGSDRTLSADVSRRTTSSCICAVRERIAHRCAREYVARGIRVRLKTTGFQMLSRQATPVQARRHADVFFTVSKSLLAAFDHPGPFRLVGMTAFDLDWRDQPLQSDLFEDRGRRDLETTIDQLVDRYGNGIIMRATDLGDSDTISDGGTNLDFLDGKASACRCRTRHGCTVTSSHTTLREAMPGQGSQRAACGLFSA